MRDYNGNSKIDSKLNIVFIYFIQKVSTAHKPKFKRRETYFLQCETVVQQLRDDFNLRRFQRILARRAGNLHTP